MKKDSLGDRMKEQYENRTRYNLPRRTYTIIRVDGKAFHTLTRGFDKPFDRELMMIMDMTAQAMCEEIQGARMAYVQSDEISILLTDFDTIKTEAWFNGNLQKMISISAAIATAKFNDATLDAYINGGIKKFEPKDLALFDSRVFTISDPIEVENYFIWRQQDATRNSIQMAGRALYSHKECDNKNMSQLQEMCFLKGVNWNDYSAREKRGGWVIKNKTGVSLDTDPPMVVRGWTVEGAPIFTQERNLLRAQIPRITEEVENVEEDKKAEF